MRAKAGPGKEPVEYRAPLVIAADGVSGKLPLAMGLTKRDDRPLGVGLGAEWLDAHQPELLAALGPRRAT